MHFYAKIPHFVSIFSPYERLLTKTKTALVAKVYTTKAPSLFFKRADKISNTF